MQSIKRTTNNQQSNANDNNGLVQMPEFPFGSIEDGDTEYGDPEDGDFEEGGPRRRRPARRVSNKAQTVARRSQKIVRAASQSPIGKVPVAPNDPHVMKAAALKDAMRRPDILYVGVKGARILSQSIGEGALLRDAEHDAVKAAIFEAVPFQPATFAFTSNALDVDAVLSTTNGGPLANGTSFRYAGYALTLAASVLNATPGGIVTLTTEMGAGFTGSSALSVLFEIQEGVYAVEFTIILGTLVSGKPRFFAPYVAVAAAASGNFTVALTNLPSNYTPSLRFLQPGDSVTDKLLGLL